MSSPKVDDRRRHRREPLAYSALVFARRGPPLACTVENLSAGGALLCAPLPLPADGPVRVRLKLSPRRDLTVSACVVRTHPPVDGSHRFAVAFLDVPPAIEDLVQSAALRALAAPRQARRVLVVDDESIIRSSLARELRALGAAARVAASASDAMGRLQDCRPGVDVAIVDAHLDPDDGLDVLRHAAAAHPDIYRVLMSGRLSHDDMMRVQASGLAQQVIAKPWNQADLERALRLGR